MSLYVLCGPTLISIALDELETVRGKKFVKAVILCAQGRHIGGCYTIAEADSKSYFRVVMLDLLSDLRDVLLVWLESFPMNTSDGRNSQAQQTHLTGSPNVYDGGHTNSMLHTEVLELVGFEMNVGGVILVDDRPRDAAAAIG